MGAVLSQRTEGDKKFHSCTFFSGWLSPSEHNYDVGNRELLAIILVLEEWGYSLEGTVTPIVIWTDHKNFAYIQEAKCLNPRRAWWSLFFA